MFVDPCIIARFIKKIQQDAKMYQNFIIPYLSGAQHVSGDTPPIIRSLKPHWQPLVFHTWKVVGRVVGGRFQAHCAWKRPPTTRPTNFHVFKTRGCQCSFRLLMMGGVSPETCWAPDKYGIIKFWYTVASCWIILYESSYSGYVPAHQLYFLLTTYPVLPTVFILIMAESRAGFKLFLSNSPLPIVWINSMLP